MPSTRQIPAAVRGRVSSTAHAQNKYAPPFPRPAAWLIVEKGDIQVWEILREKGEPTPMYEFAMDQVTVELTEGAVKFTRPDGFSRTGLSSSRRSCLGRLRSSVHECSQRSSS